MKFAVVLVLSLLLTVVLDPWTPLLLLGITLIAGLWLGRLPLRTYGGALLPLLLIGLGFVWSNALFSAYPDEAGVLTRLGPLRVSTPGLIFGTALAVRGLAIGVLSVTFILTTDPTDLIISLIRHARLPYRLGYPLLAAYRFLPFFRQEYRQIALARRVRGVLEQGFIWQRLWRRAGYIVPLLSSAVRRAALGGHRHGLPCLRRRDHPDLLPDGAADPCRRPLRGSSRRRGPGRSRYERLPRLAAPLGRPLYRLKRCPTATRLVPARCLRLVHPGW